MNMRFVSFGGAAALVVSALTANAGAFVISASSGTRAASAEFTASGGTLTIVLTNTSAHDILVQSNILTAVFFDLQGVSALSPDAAVLAVGSSVLFGPVGPGGVVGGEWAYRDGLVGAPMGADFGISSAGFGLFGPSDLFPGSDLNPPTSPNGLNYGITAAGDNPATGQPAVTGSTPLIKNSVVFTLTGLPMAFNPETDLLRVHFQYGTSLTDGGMEVQNPAPSALAPLLLGFAAASRRRR